MKEESNHIHAPWVQSAVAETPTSVQTLRTASRPPSLPQRGRGRDRRWHTAPPAPPLSSGSLRQRVVCCFAGGRSARNLLEKLWSGAFGDRWH